MFTGKHLWWSPFLNKLKAFLQNTSGGCFWNLQCSTVFVCGCLFAISSNILVRSCLMFPKHCIHLCCETITSMKFLFWYWNFDKFLKSFSFNQQIFKWSLLIFFLLRRVLKVIHTFHSCLFMLRVIYEWIFDYWDRLLLLERFYQFFRIFFQFGWRKKCLKLQHMPHIM